MEDPGKRMWALVPEMAVAIFTMKWSLNEDFHFQSYNRCKGELLTEKAEENSLTKVNKLLNKLKHPVEPETICFFYPEKNFCQDQLQNTQDNR